MLAGLTLLAAPQQGAAATVTLNVIPGTGTGLVQGDVCSTTSGQTCPTDPTFATSGSSPVSGYFQYNSGTGTANFSLTLSQNTAFGSLTLDAGSTFSGSGIAVTPNAGHTAISQTSAIVYGMQSLTFAGALTQTEGAPLISALNCTLASTVDICSVQLGPAGTGLQDSSSNSYDSFLRFNVDASAVPLPSALWSFLGGLTCLAVGLAMQRKRAHAGLLSL